MCSTMPMPAGLHIGGLRQMPENNQIEPWSTEALINDLAPFIGMRSVVGDSEGNQRAVEFLCNRLEGMGFGVSVAGRNELEQPVIVARRAADDGAGMQRILIYGHYDVVPADNRDTWQSANPYVPEIIGGRIYARGIADNKGVLLTRLLAVKDLIARRELLPEILWLIHGSEESDSPCALTRQIFTEQLAAYRADLHLEETGFNDLITDEAIMLLWRRSGEPVREAYANHLLVLTGCDRVEDRPLNKINGGQDCPFLNALPDDAIYLGFGPNDRKHRIHASDESLDLSRLRRHYVSFRDFIQGCASE